MTIHEMSASSGKSVPVLLGLISRYELTRTKTFSRGYKILLRKLIALALASVSQKDILTLLNRERDLLRLLKVDTLYTTATWFEDLCVGTAGPSRLLLSGFDLGHHVAADGVQTALDFAPREDELFSSREMGADALLALRLYEEAQAQALAHLGDELKSIAESTKWLRQVSACGLG